MRARALLTSARPRTQRLGQKLIAKEDAEGVEHLEKAMNADSDYVPVACQTLYGYMMSQGRQKEAEAYRRRLFQQMASAN